MSDINHCIVTGRLTSDANVKDFDKASVFSGTVAVNRYNSKEKKEEADFFNYKLWGNAGRQADYYRDLLKKGTAVVLDGALQTESWEKDGKKNTKVFIMANAVAAAGGKRGESSDSMPSSDFPE